MFKVYFKKLNLKLLTAVFLSLFFIFGLFGFSNFVQAAAPDAPTNVSANSSCQTNDAPEILLEWPHVYNQDVVDYWVYKDGLKVGWNINFEDSADAIVSWTDFNLLSGGTHTYNVLSVNSFDEVSISTVSITKTAPYCPAPVLSASNNYCVGLDSRVDLDWTSPANVNYFNLYRKAGIGAWDWINQFTSDTNSWTNRGLLNSQDYTYYIEADGTGWELKSNELAITTLDCVGSITPSPPPVLTLEQTCTTVGANLVNQIDLSWTLSEHTNVYTIHKSFTFNSTLYNISWNVPNDTLTFSDQGKATGDLGNIESGVDYTYYVEAINNANIDNPVSSNTNSITFSGNCFTAVAPADPTGLTTQSRCSGVDPILRLSWDPVSNATGYRIYRKLSTDIDYVYYVYANSDADTTNSTFDFDDAEVIQGDTYYYGVEARNLAGSSNIIYYTSSAPVSVCTLPIAPVLNSPISGCDSSYNPKVSLSWDQSTFPDTNTGYFESYQLGTSDILVCSTANNSNNTCDDLDDSSPVESGTTYTYQVKAIGSVGQSSTVSNQQSIQVEWCPPTTPSNLSFSQSCDGLGGRDITLNWSESKNTDYYQIYRSDTLGVLGSLVTDNLTVLTYSENISIYTDLYYTIRAVGKDVVNNADSVITISALDCALLTGAPVIDSVLSTTTCSLYIPHFHLVWSQVSNAAYYQVYRERNEAGYVEALAYTSPDGDTIFYNDNNVESDVGYYYRVVAYKNGDSKTSDAILFTIGWCPPNSPTNLSETQSCSGTQPVVDLSWTSSLNTSSYEIYRKNDNSAIIASDVPIGISASSPFLDNTVSNNVTYYYTVRAIGKDTINTADSTVYQVNAENCQPPGQSQITLASLCNGSAPYVNLLWTSDTNASWYDIHKVQASSIIPDSANVLLGNTNLATYDDTTVVSGTTYSYVALACNLSGCSSYDIPLDVRKSITVAWCPPTAPADFTALAECDGLGHSLVNLTWDADTTGNIEHYEISRSDSILLANNLANTAIAFTDSTPPLDNTTYTYTITAVGYDSSNVSSISNAITTYDCSLPAEPTITQSIASCYNSYPNIYLDWADVLNFSTLPETKYYEVQQDGITIFNTQDIVGMWHFNEGGGNTANDESIYNNDISFPGGISDPSWDTGEFGNSLNFNGTSDYLNIASDLGDPNEMTIEFWFYVSETDKTREQYFMDGRNGGNWWFLQSHNPSGSGNINFDNLVIVNSSDWDAGQWNYLALVVNSDSSKIYINGELKSTGSGLNPDLGANMRIGTRYTNSSYFKGSIDDVVIRNRALTADEIKGYYRQGEHLPPIVSEYYDYSISSANSYSYTVIAGNIGGTNQDSTATAIAVPWCPPIAPSNFSLSQVCDGVGNSNVTLNWDQDVPENVSHYIIERYNADIGMIDTLESSLDSSLRTYLDDSPPLDSANYDYKVVAVGNEGSYATSTQSILTDDCSLPNSSPDISSAVPDCDGPIPIGSFNWDSVSNADYYTIDKDGAQVYDTRWDTAGLWHFDNNALDSSGNNNNGSLINSPTYVNSGGRVGIEFNGDNYINIPNSDSLNFSGNGFVFTIEAWIRRDGNIPSGTIIGKENVYLLGINNGNIQWAIRNAGGESCLNGWCWVDTGVSVPQNQWVHIALVYNRHSVKTFLNGLLSSEILNYGSARANSSDFTHPVRIGSRGTDGVNNGFQGIIDEVKISGRPLSGLEIFTDYVNSFINELSTTNFGAINSCNDYSVTNNSDPWYLSDTHTYIVTAYNLGGSLSGVSGTVTFNNPADACVATKSYKASLSIACHVDGPGAIHPYFYNADWYGFTAGNNGVNNDNAYRLFIDGEDYGVDPNPYTFWYGSSGREYIRYKDQSLAGWGTGNHNFSMRTTDVNNNIVMSDISTANIPECNAPADINNFIVTPSCNGDQPKIDLNWDDDVTGYTNNYYVIREKQGGGTEPSSLNYISSQSNTWNNNNEGLGWKNNIFYRTAYYNVTGGELVDSNGISYDTQSWSNDLNGIVWDSTENCFWFSDDHNNAIVKTDTNFNFISSFAVDTANNHQKDIATDGTYIFLNDYYGAIFMYNKDGTLYKKIDMNKLINNNYYGEGLTYLNGYLYAGTSNNSNGKSPNSIYVINPYTNTPSIQFVANLSSGGDFAADSYYICCSGVKGITTDGTYIYVTSSYGGNYRNIDKFSVNNNGGGIKWVGTGLVSELEDTGDLNTNTLYDYYIKAYGNYFSYNISDTVSTTTLFACYNTPLKPAVSSVLPQCDTALNPYMEISWNAQAEENNTISYDLHRIYGVNDDLVIATSDSDFGSFSSGFNSCVSAVNSGVLTITCKDYGVTSGTNYQYYLLADGQGGATQSDNYPASTYITAYDCSAPPEQPVINSVAASCYNSSFDANMSINWDRTSNTFQYIVSRDCGGGLEYRSTIDDIEIASRDDVIYETDDSITYIDPVPTESVGTICYYYVKSIGYGGDAISDAIEDSIIICGNTPAPAQNLRLDPTIECEDVHLTWDDSTDIGDPGLDPIGSHDGTGGEFYFKVLRSDDIINFSGATDADCIGLNYTTTSLEIGPYNTGTAGITGTPPIPTYSDSDPILHEERYYCYKVASWNPAGLTYTDPIIAQTPKCPPGPSILLKNLLSCDKISLKWKRSENYLYNENATSYDVYLGDKATPKQTLKASLPACRCVDYTVDGGCVGFSTLAGGAGNCDSDNNLYCVDANNCCHTDCATTFFCDGTGNQSQCYDLVNKTYYYRETSSDGLPPGNIYYYTLEAQPLEISLPATDSNQLKIQPCPSLPEWRDINP